MCRAKVEVDALGIAYARRLVFHRAIQADHQPRVVRRNPGVHLHQICGLARHRRFHPLGGADIGKGRKRNRGSRGCSRTPFRPPDCAFAGLLIFSRRLTGRPDRFLFRGARSGGSGRPFRRSQLRQRFLRVFGVRRARMQFQERFVKFLRLAAILQVVLLNLRDVIERFFAIPARWVVVQQELIGIHRRLKILWDRTVGPSPGTGCPPSVSPSAHPLRAG